MLSGQTRIEWVGYVDGFAVHEEERGMTQALIPISEFRTRDKLELRYPKNNGLYWQNVISAPKAQSLKPIPCLIWKDNEHTKSQLPSARSCECGPGVVM